MNIQQEIYLELLVEFRNKQIQFALPAQNILINEKIEQDIKQITTKSVET
jgi:hypothetical protein